MKKAKMTLLKPKVIIAAMMVMAAHFQLPLYIIGIGPQNNVVHEKPTGASLRWPVLGFSKWIVYLAIC